MADSSEFSGKKLTNLFERSPPGNGSGYALYLRRSREMQLLSDSLLCCLSRKMIYLSFPLSARLRRSDGRSYPLKKVLLQPRLSVQVYTAH